MTVGSYRRGIDRMTNSSTAPRAAARRGDYGYDAPYAPLLFTFAAVASFVAAIAAAYDDQPGVPWGPIASGLFFALNAASFIYTTRRGKFVVWQRILDGMKWRGDERVLDLGCGRGAVLTMVAGRLTTGHATGIDLWSTKDQSGNSATACRQNVVLEGVGDRVTLRTGDMQALPFADESFDVVVSSLAIHNISTASGRARAIAHAVRVLAPGGRLAIADIRYAGRYVSELRRLGLRDVAATRLGWRFWYGNPFAATRLVTARKPLPGEFR